MSRTSLQTVGLEGTLTPRDLTRRLARAMTLRPYRAAIALIEVQGDALAQARAAVEAAGAETERAATPDELLIEVMEGSEADKVTLTRLNRERDPLLKAYRAVVLLVVGPKAMRWVHGVAPDLISAPDLSGILLAGATHHKPANPWGDVRRSVCEFMRTKHASLDMTGLLPSLSERRHIELDAIYLPLVELRKSHLKPAGWLVLGNPGAGKTTLLRHLALEMARGKDPLGIGEALPLLVSLADYSVFRQQERVVSLVAFLPRWFSAHSIEGGEQIADHLCEVCLLLDGLDEVHDAGVRRSILAEASGLLAHDKVAGVVITGRSFVVDEVRRQEHETLQTRKVHPPTDGEIERFLHSFARLTGREEHEAERLSQRILSDRDLKSLAQTPLMLAFMALLDEVEGQLPDQRVEIYWRLGEILLGRWSRLRSLHTELVNTRMSRGELIRLLGPLAWWIVCQGGGAVDADGLVSRLTEVEARRETRQVAEQRACELFGLLKTDTAVLVPTGLNNWAFVHSSLAEYFAAVEAERNPERWQHILDDPFQAERLEVVVFLAGILGVLQGKTEQLDELVGAVLRRSRRPGRYHSRYPSLIVALLMEDPGLSARQVRSLVRRLFEFAFTTLFAPEEFSQVHDDVCRYLEHAASGPRKDIVAEELKRWFAPEPVGICWEMLSQDTIATDPNSLFVKMLDSITPPHGHENFAEYYAAMVALGLTLSIIYYLPFALVTYNIDIKPLLDMWQHHPNARLRLAYEFTAVLMLEERLWRELCAEEEANPSMEQYSKRLSSMLSSFEFKGLLEKERLVKRGFVELEPTYLP